MISSSVHDVWGTFLTGESALRGGCCGCLCRSSSPLGDEAVVGIGKLFSAPALLEHVARSRKQARGAMFPTQLQT